MSDLRAVLPGHDAVLSALGAPGPGRTTILRAAARSMVEAMQANGVRRLLVVSAAILFDDLGFLGRLLRRTLLKNVAEDSAEMERIVMVSGLDWTIARPPRLTNGALIGRYRVENGHLPDRSAVASISRADVAHFLLSDLRHGYIHASHSRDSPGSGIECVTGDLLKGERMFRRRRHRLASPPSPLGSDHTFPAPDHPQAGTSD